MTTAAAAKAKFGTTEAEFSAVAELLGADADDEDACPTCLEAYTDGRQGRGWCDKMTLWCGLMCGVV
jgi:hypothetical protein